MNRLNQIPCPWISPSHFRPKSSSNFGKLFLRHLVLFATAASNSDHFLNVAFPIKTLWMTLFAEIDQIGGILPTRCLKRETVHTCGSIQDQIKGSHRRASLKAVRGSCLPDWWTHQSTLEDVRKQGPCEGSAAICFVFLVVNNEKMDAATAWNDRLVLYSQKKSTHLLREGQETTAVFVQSVTGIAFLNIMSVASFTFQC